MYSLKVLIMSACVCQVRFVYEVFRRLKPGVSLGGLGGHMKLNSRMNMFARFCEAKYMVLFATDVAARGLDFPKVDWVLQVDCPENVDTYIHRVGRTARYVSGKNSWFPEVSFVSAGSIGCCYGNCSICRKFIGFKSFRWAGAADAATFRERHAESSGR